MVRAEAAAGLRLLSGPARERRLTWLDVFTAEPLAGNALAVVHGADDLDAATMAAFARETRLSETTFVQSATVGGASYRNRIFTMGGELPFAGHPSLGTAVAVARERGLAEASFVQETGAGLQPVDVTLDGDRGRASMLQAPATFGAEVDPEAALAAAGLGSGDAAAGLPPQVVSTGVAHLLVPVRDPSVLARAAPSSFAQLDELLTAHGAVVLYLAAVGAERAPGGEAATARGFFTAPGETTEDPATGSAAGPLLAYLHARRGDEALVVRQGIEMGRPSRLECRVEGERIRVGGACVVVGEGVVRLPSAPSR